MQYKLVKYLFNVYNIPTMVKYFIFNSKQIDNALLFNLLISKV